MVSDSEPAVDASGEFGHKHNCWLTIARHEKVDTIEKLNGYKFPIQHPCCNVQHIVVRLAIDPPVLSDWYNCILIMMMMRYLASCDSQ